MIVVDRWISWKDSEAYPEAEHSGMAYADRVKALKEAGREITGEEHQNLEDGVPLFSDGKVFRGSWRGWGSVMADVWGGCYMDYYMKIGA